MSDAVGSTAHALDASREEQGLCPHMKNPAFDAGMVFLAEPGPVLWYWDHQTAKRYKFCACKHIFEGEISVSVRRMGEWLLNIP